MATLHSLKMLVGAGARRVSVLALILLGIAVMASSFMLLYRHGQERRGHGAVDSPGMPAVAYAEDAPRLGRFEVELEYTCYGVPGDGEVSSTVLWDDAWFSWDPGAYNHALGRACSVLSAIAYSESGYYQGGSDTPPYMENALHELGFDEVDTGSYRYRSEVVDEVLDVMTQESDGVAYALARKELEPVDGVPRELLLVSARGSYGSEWLSNFNMGTGEAAATAYALAEDRARDHSGYQIAACEILSELDTWLDDAEHRGAEVSILLTGHSRGGAVAGLLASMLDDRAARGGAATSRVYAYTFASPRTTASDQGDSDRYCNIFNIVNPADMVTRVPLEGWGYVRYGVDLELPAVDDAAFEGRHASMRAAFAHLTGSTDDYDPQAKLAIDDAVSDMVAAVPTASDLLTPRGVASVAAACATRLDATRILRGHYPSVYIAWMESLPGL